MGLHFFDRPDAEVFPFLERFERSTIVPGALQHIAFALPKVQAATLLRQRVRASGIDVTPATNLGDLSNMLFRDNNGLLLEATWPNYS